MNIVKISIIIFIILSQTINAEIKNLRFTGSVREINNGVARIAVTVAWDFYEVDHFNQFIFISNNGFQYDLFKSYYIEANRYDNGDVEILKTKSVYDFEFLEYLDSLDQPIFVGNQTDDFNLLGYYLDLGSIKYVNWFGIYYTKGHPWWYHYDFGWIYDYYVSSSSLWFWSPELGWVYTDGELMPFLFTIDRGWLYFHKIKLGESWLYSFTEDEWQYYRAE